jgi:short-subunit dehydrogenase
MAKKQPEIVVVTGSSAGLGRGIALAFAAAGARVALLARSQTGLDSTTREIEAKGGTASSHVVDVSDAVSMFAAADEIAERWGTIDVWVNCAMVTVFGALSELSAEEFRRVTEVTYLGCVYGTMAALKHMRERNAGRIIQIGSALSYRAIPLQSAYCGSKFAIRGFTDSLRSELRHERSAVRLMMVQLPAVNTPQFDWARNKTGRLVRPLPPVFQPEAIASHVVRASRSMPRELWIGRATIQAIFGTVLFPGALDRLLAKGAYRGQMTAEPAPAGEVDNLDLPPLSGHATHGRFDDEARTRVSAFAAPLLRVVALVSSAGLVSLLTWLTVSLRTSRKR